jgi:hypothetical protein
MRHAASLRSKPAGLSRRLVPIIAAALLCAAAVTAACAADVARESIPTNKHVHFRVANDEGARFDLFGNDSYYVKFDGGGLASLHVTTNPLDRFGQVTRTNAANGSFFITDTGGRGVFDDIILLVAVRDPLPDDFKVRIRSSGYTWAPTPEVNKVPDRQALTYHETALDETFDAKDFRYEPQSWKPSGTPNFPVMEGADPKAPENVFRFLFVDLYVGELGLNSELVGLKDHGAAKVEFSLANTSSPVAFDIYAYNNQSNQGKGVSWSNMVSGQGASGFVVQQGVTPGTFTSDREYAVIPIGGGPGAANRTTPTITPTSIPTSGILDQVSAAVLGFLQSLGLTGGGSGYA